MIFPKRVKQLLGDLILRILAPNVIGRVSVFIALCASLTFAYAQYASAQGVCLPSNNEIVCENAETGNPASEWDISGSGDPSIQGFATDISVDQGQTVRFKIDTDATDYRLDIYRMGYYGGLGARRVETVLPTAPLPQTQPSCLNDVATGLIDCGNWAESASWSVPADAVSGIYFAKVVRSDTNGANHIVFIVRDDDGGSDILFQTSDTTWHAYNMYGGNSLYVGQPAGRAYKVSYNRPFITREVYPEDWVFNAEYPMVRWLEANGYDVSYSTGVDSDRLGAELLEHQIFLSVGHDEYWSNDQRLNVEAARDAGVNLSFLSGNFMFWKTRWEDSIDGSDTPYRTLVSYKETHDNAKSDPEPNIWTGTWRDPRFSPPADGGRPENALSGSLFKVNVGTYTMEVPEADGKMRFWRNTSVATLNPGETASLADFTVGYEWDEDADNGFRPAGLIRLSTTDVTDAEILVDYGSTFEPGAATHSLTLYRANSGALVFGAGTVQWSWGLDGNHDRLSSTPDDNMIQAMVNLFADMDVQPETLESGFVPATKSTDTAPPTVSISSPSDGSTTQLGQPIGIAGTAVDTGGGVVGGVEVSVDGGATWQRADGRANWSYSWTPDAIGAISVQSRAADDSANLGAATGIIVNVSNGPDTTPPTVLTVSPVNDATGVALNSSMTVVFSEGMDPASINGNTIELRDGTNTLVPATVTYDAPSQTATLVTTSNFVDGTLYTATVLGGAADPRVKDLVGNALAQNYVWSFSAGCPCSIWDASVVPVNPAEQDSSAIEVGVKFQADSDGSITGLRFYKGSGNSGTHIGNLWTSTGQLLATGIFVNETATGWQQLDFAAPVAISANVTYIASYHTETGFYAQDSEYFSAGGVNKPPLRALSNVEAGGNGVYAYGPSAFPTQTTGSSNYWVDVVYSPNIGPDISPPLVLSMTPADGAVLISPNTDVAITFNEPMDPASIGSSTFELRDGANNVIDAAISFDAASRKATLNPTDALAYSTQYIATVRGGANDPRVKDTSGNALVSDQVWSFTTDDPPPIPANDGPGGPILVLSSASNPFGRYFNEILRAEGLNLFLNIDISLVSAPTLVDYDVVILGEMSLTAAQVTMLSDWVNAGGNLIAMRPDKQLAGLLGLTDLSATLSEGYLQIDTSTQPGNGIVGETIQYHGTADLYSLSGATAVATLYSDASTPVAGNAPAVTLNSVGANGGQAATFAYDLARSIVYARQGNPAWAGQERDGNPPIRSNDMFFGNAAADPQPDWVNLDKVAIPQADEQQRLLANLIQLMNLDRKPLPRFWYFPGDNKAVVVMTGDDHGVGLTSAHFDAFTTASPANCSVSDWECIRGTSYIYPGTLSDGAAAAYSAAGFEIALHVDTGCAAYTEDSLRADYSYQLDLFSLASPSLPDPVSQRTHCIAWSDWVTQAIVENDYGIRLDTTYYYWPDSWISGREGFFTGSGMPMRYADVDGTIIDTYQAATQMTDESGQIYPASANTLLDRALGPEGYYGAFTTNMHTDRVINNAMAIVGSAQDRDVPVVTARQMLDWLDGRNNSSFSSISWNNDTLEFTISTGQGANNIRAMLPLQTSAGPITDIERNGLPVSFTTEVVKGIEYAVFPAQDGIYQASVGPPLAISLGWFLAERTGDAVSFRWETSTEVSTAGFDLLAEGDDGTLNKLNGELIPSKVIDSITPTDYAFTATSDASSFYLHELDIYGHTSVHGPFGLGTEHGATSTLENAEFTPRLWLPIVAYE